MQFSAYYFQIFTVYLQYINKSFAGLRTRIIYIYIDMQRESYIKSTYYNSDKPTLIQFGWTGSTHEELIQKQQLLKDSIGAAISVSVPVVKTMFGDLSQLNNELIEKLHEFEHTKIHAIFYSGGGSLHHPRVMENNELNNLISTQIFDSAPVPGNSNVFMGFIDQKCSDDLIVRLITKALLYVPMSMYFYFWEDRINEYIKNITNSVDKKTMFIYSQSDPLTPEGFMDNIAKERYRLIFESSDHLDHDIKYPQLYKDSFDLFTKNVV